MFNQTHSTNDQTSFERCFQAAQAEISSKTSGLTLPNYTFKFIHLHWISVMIIYQFNSSKLQIEPSLTLDSLLRLGEMDVPSRWRLKLDIIAGLDHVERNLDEKSEVERLLDEIFDELPSPRKTSHFADVHSVSWDEVAGRPTPKSRPFGRPRLSQIVSSTAGLEYTVEDESRHKDRLQKPMAGRAAP